MYVVTLLTNPARPHLTTDSVASLSATWGGPHTPTWLSPGEAVSFHIPMIPSNQSEVSRRLQNEGVDLVILPLAQAGPKKMLLADMDSTMIDQECIDELAAEAGIGPKVAAITARAMNGELDFEAALTERVGLLAGLDTRVIEHVLKTRITYAAGSETLLATMKSRGAHAVLVSGGFTAFTGVVARHLGFDAHHANTLLHDNGALTGRVALPILGADAKRTALHDITAAKGLTPADVVAVGDGANDVPMLLASGLGVALHAKPSVQQSCSVAVNHSDLTALLYLQGIARTDFVTP
ncbi:MAG: phosphoserine phosphatase [Paracoccaceae bacterium]|jgi:phosphoserine phosphatase